MTETLSLPDVHALARDCLARAGVPAAAAAAAAAEVAAAEAAGERAHGLEALLRDLRLLRYGRLHGGASWQAMPGTAAVLHVDAQHGFAAAALAGTLPDLVQCARSQGIAILHLERASAPGAMLAPMTALQDSGLVALSLNEDGAARLSDPDGRSPRILRSTEVSPLMSMLGLGAPIQDTPLGGTVAHRCWLLAANPMAVGPMLQAMAPTTETARNQTAVAQVTLAPELLEQIVTA